MPIDTLPSRFGGQRPSILVRATNWIGDAIMTLPAVRTIRSNFPQARLTVLAQPWVADIFTANPMVDEVILYRKKGEHAGITGMWRLSRQLAVKKFDLAILLQNAFEAALIARMAGIPVIAGYKRDGRGLLLTHPVPVSQAIRRQHQVLYYQHLLTELGLSPGANSLYLYESAANKAWADDFLHPFPGPVIGLNPGAAYGPAKRWPAERYGQVAKTLLASRGGTVLVFGTEADAEAAATIGQIAGRSVVDLTGKTSLAQAMALIGRCSILITNDSGLMHVAAAHDIPQVAIFGSTDTVATGPFSERAVVITKSLPCSPCLKARCPTDFECMTGIAVDEVTRAAQTLLDQTN